MVHYALKLFACLLTPALLLLRLLYDLLQELAADSLHDRLHHQRRRPEYGLFLQLAEDIAGALEHCHSQRPPVVHRDLSAKNVLLGLDGRARVADFGLAATRRRTFLSNDKASSSGRVLPGWHCLYVGACLWDGSVSCQGWEVLMQCCPAQEMQQSQSCRCRCRVRWALRPSCRRKRCGEGRSLRGLTSSVSACCCGR